MRKQFIPYAAALTTACFLSLSGGAVASPTFIFDAFGFNKLNTGDLVAAAGAQGVDLAPIAGATLNGGVFSFRIIGGAVDAQTIVFESVSVGGFKIVRGSSVVAFNSPIVNTTESQPIMTFLVTLNGDLQGRYAVFNLKVPDYTKPQPLKSGGKVHAANIEVTLSKVGANILNTALSTTALKAGTPVGTLTVKGKLGQEIPE